MCGQKNSRHTASKQGEPSAGSKGTESICMTSDKCQWLAPVIIATWEAESRGLQFEASSGLKTTRQSKMDWRCGSSGRALASVQIPVPQKTPTSN
jgi:hypothetical protein